MANAKRDENRQVVALGWDADNSTTLPFLVDPSTGRLLVEMHFIGMGSPVVSTGNAKRDSNYEPVAMGVSTDGNPMTLHIDATNGYLAIDTD